jgi:hypothetical protein
MEGEEIVGVFSAPKERQQMAREEIMRGLEAMAREEYDHRQAYRTYLDYMMRDLKNVQMRISLEMTKYRDSYIFEI